MIHLVLLPFKLDDLDPFLTHTPSVYGHPIFNIVCVTLFFSFLNLLINFLFLGSIYDSDEKSLSIAILYAISRNARASQTRVRHPLPII